MVTKWQITIPELSGEEKRNVYLYLPESYQYDHNKRYPVLYMFDGHNVFFDSDATYGKCWGMKEYMDDTNTQMIIAAVECSHDPDNGRLKEYSPFDFSDPSFGPIPGWGRLTMEWFVHTLKPDIDRRFRTLADRKHTFIAGSSMGGLMSLYAVLQYNHIFSRAAALSPSLWTNRNELKALIHRSKPAEDTVLYMDYGSEEMKLHSGMKPLFQETISLLLNKPLYLTSRIVPGGTHCEASWEKQLPFVISTLTYSN